MERVGISVRRWNIQIAVRMGTVQFYAGLVSVANPTATLVGAYCGQVGLLLQGATIQSDLCISEHCVGLSTACEALHLENEKGLFTSLLHVAFANPKMRSIPSADFRAEALGWSICVITG